MSLLELLNTPRANSKLLLFSLVAISITVCAAFDTPKGLYSLFMPFLFLMFLLTLCRHFFIFYFATKENHKTFDTIPEKYFCKKNQPLVSVIIPAYNEEAVIESSIISVINMNYFNLEVIVVDDGSTDQTSAIARRVAKTHSHKTIKVIQKANGGKASALNIGWQQSKGEFILCADADSCMDENAILWALPHFENPNVDAVGGFVEVANQNSLLLKFQQLEYFLSLNFTRKALSYFGAVTVIPGPVGIFRRHAIKKVGGYNADKDIFAEDAELTVRLLANGSQLKGENRMISRTEGPDSIYDLLRQRYRWKRGLYQAFIVSLPNLLKFKTKRRQYLCLFLVYESFLSEIINFCLTLFFVISFYRTGEFGLFSIWFVSLIAIDLITMIYISQKNMPWYKWFAYLVLQKVTYFNLLQSWGVLALFDEWIGEKMSWDKLDRIGQISSQEQP